MTAIEFVDATVQLRDTTLNPREVRGQGLIPATIYGKDVEPVSIQIPSHEFTQLFLKGKRYFNLQGLDKAYSVRAHQLQIQPVTQAVQCVEFLVIDDNNMQRFIQKTADNAATAKADAKAKKAVEAAH